MLDIHKSFRLTVTAVILGGMLLISGCQTAAGLGLLAWSLGMFDKDGGGGNNQPQILSVTAVPNTVNLGGTTVLTVVAVDVDNDDTLTYQWTSSDGTLQSPTDAVCQWTAPNQNTGTYYINITVSDGKDSVTSKIGIIVN